MKHKRRLLLILLLLILLLVPVPLHLKDGGTVVYQAALYRIERVCRISPAADGGVQRGTVVRVLGIELLNTVHETTE